jgi:RimJ/RimL family protein N-acetyltransferase
MVHHSWPLFDLVIRTPRLEIRLARESEFEDLVAVIEGGIHDPASMPFTHPWTDDPPPQRNRDSYQWWWRQRADWSRDKWSFDGSVYLDGRVIGVQQLMATQFAELGTVSSGSWLGLAHQGQGYGKEMRAGILHLAFAGLGAQEAYSGAFTDNHSSRGTSRSLGYEENGSDLKLRRGQPHRMVNFRLDRSSWAAQARPDCTLEGLEGCLDMFGAPFVARQDTDDSGGL